MYDSILYPTDGGDSAREAFDHVRDLAERYDAAVHVLYVVDGSHRALGIGENPNREASPGMVGDPSGAETPMGGDPDASREARAKATAHGRGLVREVGRRLQGVETAVTVRGGDPSEIIPDYADEHDVDAIVMGTHPRTGIERYLFGSVTESVLRTANVPVLVVPDADDPVDTEWNE